MNRDSQGLDQAATQSRENQLRFVLSVAGRHRWFISITTLCVSLGWGILGMVTMGWGPSVPWQAEAKLLVRKSPYEKPFFQEMDNSTLFTNTPKAVVARMNTHDIAEDIGRALIQNAILTGGKAVLWRAFMALKTFLECMSAIFFPNESKTLSFSSSSSIRSQFISLNA